MSVDEIVNLAAERFPSFGGSKDRKANDGNPLTAALRDKPAMFALGVDIREVVQFVLEKSAIGKN